LECEETEAPLVDTETEEEEEAEEGIIKRHLLNVIVRVSTVPENAKQL
jgi:hypothetical protein